MTQSTADLVRAAATGDRAAFEMLVRQNAAMVTGVAYSRCGDFGLSEDIAQEAFIEAWKNLATIHEPEKFPGWICTIARRRAIDAVRRDSSTRVESTLGTLTSEIPDHKQLTPEASMSNQQERELVWAMLARLPEAYREPLILFYRCEESTRDVAIALGESEATIRQRLKRGRDMLRTEMTDSIRVTLGATVPKAAFAAMVMASLPSTTYAAGAATASATAAKSSSAFGAAATSAFGGAVFGSLIGIAGGIFGTWMSWKNCEYASQQRFILRQSIHFAAGLVIFLILLEILVTLRVRGMIPSDTAYATLLVGLILGSQGLGFVWMWREIRGYKQIAENARLCGEPIRESAQRRIDRIREQTQVIHDDGSITYEAFRWNAGGWFGSCVGASAWLIPLTGIAWWHGATSTAIVTSLAYIVIVAIAFALWRLRERLDAYIALQIFVAFSFLSTTAVFAGLQFLGNAKTQQIVQWTPWVWCLLMLFPLISLCFWWMRHSFQRNIKKWQN
jgi:RNA polymerase sigma factor (sigma-70 family)